nr:hypothetical protein [Tanacetum cinerariifolium]
MLGTGFEARVRDYKATHTEKMERFKNAIFKQRENINADSGINGTHMEMPLKEAKKETEAENGTKNKPIKRAEREEIVKASSSQPIGYYLKHRINEKLIEGLVDNHRHSLAIHLYIYPLVIAEDVLVEVVEHVYAVDFMILDTKEDEKRPFILGTPLKTAKAVIKFEKGTITLRYGKSKISFHKIP